MAEIPTKTGTINTSTMPNRRDAGDDVRDRLGVGRGSHGIHKPSKRAKIVEVIKTLLWVIPLTILIWVYAEREQLQKDEEITQVPIKLKSTASDRMMMLNNPLERVTLVLNGPKAGISKVRTALEEPGSALQVEISDDLRLPFDGEIQLAERIARNSLFAKEAVTVVQTKPATVKIKAEKKVTVSAKVQMRPDDRVSITDVKFTPEEITLDVPASVVGPTTQPDALPVYADLKALIDQGQGTHTAKVSVLFAPEQSAWIIPPQTVTATVTIGASKSLKISSIPIWVRVQAFRLQQEKLHFSFDPADVVRDVEVAGPARAIDELDKRIRDRRFTPMAFIDITPDNLSTLVSGEGSFSKKLLPKNYEMPDDLAKDLKVTSPIDFEVLVNVKPKDN